MADPEELLDQQNYDDIVIEDEENKEIVPVHNEIQQDENKISENHEDTFASIEMKPKEDISQNKPLELENTIQPELLDEHEFREQNDSVAEKHSYQGFNQEEEKLSDKNTGNISTQLEGENKELQSLNKTIQQEGNNESLHDENVAGNEIQQSSPPQNIKKKVEQRNQVEF